VATNSRNRTASVRQVPIDIACSITLASRTQQ
jgi:hypothetical protein